MRRFFQNFSTVICIFFLYTQINYRKHRINYILYRILEIYFFRTFLLEKLSIKKIYTYIIFKQNILKYLILTNFNEIKYLLKIIQLYYLLNLLFYCVKYKNVVLLFILAHFITTNYSSMAKSWLYYKSNNKLKYLSIGLYGVYCV